EKANFLPEAHTDMIFAIIGEELGLVGATVVIAAYAAFAYFGLRISLRCKDPFGKRLAAGLTVLVCGQAAINLAAVMGLAPLTGIPLRSCPTAAPASWWRSSRWASSLTSRAMPERDVPACLIAAGGTAGHVLPALA